MKHWRRQLRDGVEFFFRAPDGTTASGSIAPAAAVEELQRLFEKATSCSLPPAEWKGSSKARSATALHHSAQQVSEASGEAK